MSRELLRLRGVHFVRNDRCILQDISLSVQPGEIATLIGPNGAGKSTLVQIALGLLRPTRGEVVRRAESVGYVPQAAAFEPTLPICVSRFLRLERGARRAQCDIDAMLDQTGVGGLADASLHSLSGGEMRRVLLARALLRNPQLLVMDEPSAGLDINGQGEFYRLIESIRAARNCGVLLVSHDLYMVMAATNKVYCLNRHLCCSGQPDAVRRHPEFLALFGTQAARELAVYRHHQDRHNNVHDDVQDDVHGDMQSKAQYGNQS